VSPVREPVPSPSKPPTCVDAPAICDQIYEWTGLSWLAEGSYYILVKPLRIMLIIALAMIARFLVHRLINRVVRHVDGNGIQALRPLRDRMPVALRDAAGSPSERRRARAAALGSILRSIGSVVIFSIAVMMVLGELGVNLAPILAGAGIAGLAIGFGAQNLVRDFLSGLFMLLEDQYGVGDQVEIGDVTGAVEAVGLRITTVRDDKGVLWYIRNGEIQRLGNKSQGWAKVMVDVPVGYAGIEDATDVLNKAASTLVDDPDWGDDLIEAPQVLGVEELTTDGAVVRVSVRTPPDAQWRVGRELRRRLTEALHVAGMADRTAPGRVTVTPAPVVGDGPDPAPAPAAGGTGAAGVANGAASGAAAGAVAGTVAAGTVANGATNGALTGESVTGPDGGEPGEMPRAPG